MTTPKLKGNILKKIILLLILIQTLVASPFLVKEHNFIVIEEGKLFSINDEKQKYKFESINFELELINNSIDLKHVKSITFYKGNKGRKFAKSTMISCAILGVGAGFQGGDLSGILVGAATAIPFGTIAYFIGLLISDEDNYIISDKEWRFIP